jgi:hypothetical protein
VLDDPILDGDDDTEEVEKRRMEQTGTRHEKDDTMEETVDRMTRKLEKIGTTKDYLSVVSIDQNGKENKTFGDLSDAKMKNKFDEAEDTYFNKILKLDENGPKAEKIDVLGKVPKRPPIKHRNENIPAPGTKVSKFDNVLKKYKTRDGRDLSDLLKPQKKVSLKL